MADAQTPVARLDVDILADIQRWIYTYPPLSNDRRHIQVRVEDGVVRIAGNIKSPITRDYLRRNLGEVAGVHQIDDLALHDDDAIRLALGTVVPPGTIANLEWGIVILSGVLPTDEALEALVTQIAQIPGVQRVVAVGG